MKKIILLSILMVATTLSAFCYNSLRVGDPRQSWYTSQGTIDDATISVKPKGLYMEYGIYLTFSAKGTNYNASDSLEVTFNFDLPGNSIVTDSWLWIGDKIARAKIMDVWTASSIYEGIVKRRKDPSILTKLSANSYQLKVFPMAANETRKVKITVLVPTQWSNGIVKSRIPASFLSTSYTLLPEFKLITLADSVWTNPNVPNLPNLTFNEYSDLQFGKYKYSLIPSAQYNNNLEIAFRSPMRDQMYASRYSKNTNVYQLAILPSMFLDSIASKKVAVLIDYDVANSASTKTDILNKIKATLRTQLTEKDSFNLIASNLSIYRYSNKWILADSAHIELAFSAISSQLSNYSNLTSLIINGIDFVKSNSYNGKILLITNSSQYGDNVTANNLVKDIVKTMSPVIPIHIASYQDQNQYNSYHYFNGKYYYGNEYFNANLAQLTGGSYYSYFQNNKQLDECMKSNLSELSGSINSFDIYTTMTGGYCFSRYNLGQEGSSIFIDQPILQVGKYYGSFPMKISVSGEINSKIFNKEITLNASDVHVADSVSEQIWTGLYISELESQSQTSTIIASIVTKSIDERVLSKYTSFLCLEDTSYLCDGCKDESALTSIKETGKDSLLSAYPNPFTDNVVIKVPMGKDADYSSASFRIYNMQGQQVREFTYSDALINGDFLEFTWNTNSSDVPKGIYMFVMIDKSSKKTMKLIKQ